MPASLAWKGAPSADDARANTPQVVCAVAGPSPQHFQITSPACRVAGPATAQERLVLANVRIAISRSLPASTFYEFSLNIAWADEFLPNSRCRIADLFDRQLKAVAGYSQIFRPIFHFEIVGHIDHTAIRRAFLLKIAHHIVYPKGRLLASLQRRQLQSHNPWRRT